MFESTLNPISRRDAVRLFATGAVALSGASFLARSATTASAATTTTTAPTALLGFELPPLPYAYAALEPHLDAKTVEIHHDKHHAAYITNAKKLLEPHPELIALGAQRLLVSLDKVPEAIRTGVRNNVGGHVNHTFFWLLLAPPAAYQAGKLQAEITKTFDSVDAFKTQFAAAAASRFGSGWVWLSVKASGGLVIHSTPNQDSVDRRPAARHRLRCVGARLLLEAPKSPRGLHHRLLVTAQLEPGRGQLPRDTRLITTLVATDMNQNRSLRRSSTST
jgi:Fe-Mn family superoxide dismutase